MNPRIAKEIRIQAPVLGLIIACGLAMAVVTLMQASFHNFNTEPTLLGVYFVGCLFMAASAFGNEFHHRTMSLLLSQPVSRQQLWPEKMRVLAGFSALSALATLLGLLFTSIVPWQHRHEELLSICGILVFVPVLFCCSAPYFALVSKSTVGGIVFTLFAGGMLLVLSGEIWSWLSVIPGLSALKDKLTYAQLDGQTFTLVILSIPYCGLLYWLGRRRFLQLEVIDSQSLEANLPQGLETTLANFSARFKSPFSRLFFKELRLQRISLMLTAMFCIFMAVERLTWSVNNERTFVVAGILCIYLFLFPVIVCATAVADEKTWGMKDWHLTLPPSLNKQWRIKWLVAFTLSLILGAGLTWLLAHSGPWRKELGIGWDSEMLCYPVLIAAALYAGSISTSTIRALLLTFGMVAAYWLILSVFFAVFASFPQLGYNPTVTWMFVLCVVLAQLYSLVLRLLWNLLVWPVYLVTGSQEKAAALGGWADADSHNLRAVLLGLYAASFFWLLLRFARTNYRHSNLVKGHVVRQLLVLLVAAIFLVVVVAGKNHAWPYIPLP